MAKLNISQAAKAVGKDRRTIQRHIGQGKLSCEINGNGQKLLETSELIRVYGELKEIAAEEKTRQDEQKSQRTASAAVEILQQENAMLKEQVGDLKQEREIAREREKELREIVIKQQTLLLPSPKAESGESTNKPGFFSRFFSR